MTTFKSLGLNAELLKAVEKLGFETPTDVQDKVIPILLEQDTVIIIKIWHRFIIFFHTRL